MKRFLTFLLLASCAAFGEEAASDTPPKNAPDGGSADGGGPSGPADASVADVTDGHAVDGGATDATGTLQLVDLTEWHDEKTPEIHLPISAKRASGDLLVAVVSMDSTTAPTVITPPSWLVVNTANNGPIAATVLTHTIEGDEPAEVVALLTGTANASVLVALYRGASGVGSAAFNAVAGYTNQTLATPSRPVALPDDMLLIVYAGAVSSYDVSFSVPQGFTASQPYTMASHGGFGASAKNGSLAPNGTTFVSAVTKTAYSVDAVATLVLVRD